MDQYYGALTIYTTCLELVRSFNVFETSQGRHQEKTK